MSVAASFWQNPVVIALAVGIPGTVVAILGYRRAMKVDKIAEQAGIATREAASIGQVVDGLNTIIANLRTDNAEVREIVKAQRLVIQELEARVGELEKIVSAR